MRTYEGGRPTTGWKRGDRITSLDQVNVGDILISVSHQFKAENLVRVVETSKIPQGFTYDYADHRTTDKMPGNPPMFCHDFQLREDSRSGEYFRAIGRARKPKRKPVPPMPAWLIELTN